MSGHAILSPSGAKKWLNCPGARRLEAYFPEQDTVYTEQGTLAHAIGELKLKRLFKKINSDYYDRELKALRASEHYSKSLEDAVGVYVGYIQALAVRQSYVTTVLVEKRLELDAYVPECFGTADCLLFSGSHLHVIDYKNGAGVPVSAEDNPQLKLYALGALEAYKAFYDIETVHLAIVQPNAGGVSEWELDAETLKAWGEHIKPLAIEAFLGTGECKPGDWCADGFCKARAQCKTRAEAFEAVMDEAEALQLDLLTNEDIGRLLKKAEGFDRWYKALTALALEKSLNGEEVEGWKAVEGISRRTIPDGNVEELVKRLTEHGIAEPLLFTKKLLGISEFEKLVGKKDFNALVGDLLEKPKGKPTLVPVTDKRKPYERFDAVQAFSN